MTTQTEALKRYLDDCDKHAIVPDIAGAFHFAWQEALAQPEQKYRRGNRLICLETEEYCVIHISGTDRQWVKFPDSHIGVYTNEQVAKLFELFPKEPEQEPVTKDQWWAKELEGFWGSANYVVTLDTRRAAKTALTIIFNTTPPQRTWVGLTDEELELLNDCGDTDSYKFAQAIEAKLKEKNNG